MNVQKQTGQVYDRRLTFMWRCVAVGTEERTGSVSQLGGTVGSRGFSGIMYVFMTARRPAGEGRGFLAAPAAHPLGKQGPGIELRSLG